MTSNAYTEYLEALLEEADDLLAGRPGPGRGRRFWSAANRLGRATDAAVRVHLVDTLGVPNPWPA